MGRTILGSIAIVFALVVRTPCADHESTLDSTGASNMTATTDAAGRTVAVAPGGATAARGESAVRDAAVSPLRRPAVLPALYIGSGALQAFDAYSTMKALELGGVEANPVMKGVVASPIAFIGIKASVTAASILAAERMWKNHHRLAAIATMAASNGLMAWVAAHNASVVEGLRR